MTREQTLDEVLRLIGITHEPSAIEGKRDWFDSYGDLIGTFGVDDGWAEVHAWCLACAEDTGCEMGVLTAYANAGRGMVH